MAETHLAGLILVSQEVYDEMLSHDADVKYIVTDGKTVKEYLGDTLIKEGKNA